MIELRKDTDPGHKMTLAPLFSSHLNDDNSIYFITRNSASNNSIAHIGLLNFDSSTFTWSVGFKYKIWYASSKRDHMWPHLFRHASNQDKVMVFVPADRQSNTFSDVNILFDTSSGEFVPI